MTPLEVFTALGINPTPATYEEYLDSWDRAAVAAKALKDLEMTMRKALFAASFPSPKEGANTFALADGRKLKGTYKIDRGIDESQIALARAEYELVNDRPCAFDELLRVKHDLVISNYRKLDPASPAMLAVSRMVTTKVGAPALEITG